MSIYKVKKFRSVDECNEWFNVMANTIKVISGNLAIGPSGESLSSPILITYEDIFACKTDTQESQS